MLNKRLVKYKLTLVLNKLYCSVFGHSWKYVFGNENDFPFTSYRICKRCREIESGYED